MHGFLFIMCVSTPQASKKDITCSKKDITCSKDCSKDSDYGNGDGIEIRAEKIPAVSPVRHRHVWPPQPPAAFAGTLGSGWLVRLLFVKC